MGPDGDAAADGSRPPSTGGGGGALHASLAAGGEFDLIRTFLQRSGAARPSEELVGPGDDCAVIVGGRIALSSDMSVEDVHFRREWLTPGEIGWRACSAAMSDLAAMGARPIGILVSLAVPEADARELAISVMDGVREAVESVGGVVLGGDLTRSPGPVVVDVTVVGTAEHLILRSGARPGDEVWVTGQLGASAAAVRALLAGQQPSDRARERFAHPTPRIAEARILAETVTLTSLIDVSDGLLGDAAQLATASGVAVVLDAAAIPVDRAAMPGLLPAESLRLAVAGGEDYELCFTAAAGVLDEPVKRQVERDAGIPLTRVGVVEAGEGVHWRSKDGGRTPAGPGGYQHFGESS